MLFRAPVLAGIASGAVTLAFRRWARPRLRAGGRLRTPAGELAVLAVDRVAAPSEAEARGAGFASAAELLASLPGAEPIWRIIFERRDDPRVALRAAVPGPDELAAIRAALARLRFDAAECLALIGANPGGRAPELAAWQGIETAVFKRRVRQLKELGLTESLATGYRLSPRGRVVRDGE